MKRKITISIDEYLLEEIDRKRGLVSRSRFIESILEKALRMSLDKAIVPPR